MTRCDAVKPYWVPGTVYCVRPATWRCKWSGGYMHYCAWHKRHRLSDKALKDWKKIS